MAGRYLITGTQLGMLIVEIKQNPNGAEKMVNNIIENQFLGNSDNNIQKDVAEMNWEENQND